MGPAPRRAAVQFASHGSHLLGRGLLYTVMAALKTVFAKGIMIKSLSPFKTALFRRNIQVPHTPKKRLLRIPRITDKNAWDTPLLFR